MELFFEHGFVLLTDALAEPRYPRARLPLIQQGFARLSSSLMVFIRTEEALVVSEVSQKVEDLAGCSEVVNASLYSASGDVRLAGTTPADIPIWTGRPGWVRLAVGQQLVAVPIDDWYPEFRLVIIVDEADGDAPSIVRRADGSVTNDLVEEAEPVVFPAT